MEDDLYPMSHLFYAAGELGIDFLKINDFPTLQKLCKEKLTYCSNVRFWQPKLKHGQNKDNQVYVKCIRLCPNRGNGIISYTSRSFSYT